MPIPTVVLGLGPVGRKIAQLVLQRAEFELVAVVDSAAKLAGKRLADLIGANAGNLCVTANYSAALALARGGLVLQATGSRLSDVAADVLSAVRAGVSVISSCPELAFPWLDQRETAKVLDQAARDTRTAILGVGVNPGFALDRLVVCAGQVSGAFRHVLARRSVDISNRRLALLKKAGAGLSEAEFHACASAGTVGHLGLRESAALVALGLGIDFDEIQQELHPVISETAWDGPIPIKPGQAAGYHQTARVLSSSTEFVRLDLTYAVGAANCDSILIDADPKINMDIEPNVSGDVATAHAVVNGALRIMRAGTGLRTVLDLPLCALDTN